MAGVVLEHELLHDLGQRTLGLVGEVERLAVGEHPVAHLETCALASVPSSATATASSVPIESLATRWRSSSERTARRRLRSNVACSYSCASAAACIRACRSRSIVR